jgi:caffeoyl-CoA O-methyltransferase
MTILKKYIEKYINKHLEEESLLLKNLNKETKIKTKKKFCMMCGHYQGRVLSTISKLIKPKSILEIGTFTGYSTLCLAEGLTKNGILITIDINKKWENITKKYFSYSKYYRNIKQIYGNSIKIIPNLKKKFDLVFIDADKKNYIFYFNKIIKKMYSGGVIITDNVLWYKKSFFIHLYNEKLKKNYKIENIILPIRKGLSISIIK